MIFTKEMRDQHSGRVDLERSPFTPSCTCGWRGSATPYPLPAIHELRRHALRHGGGWSTYATPDLTIPSLQVVAS